LDGWVVDNWMFGWLVDSWIDGC